MDKEALILKNLWKEVDEIDNKAEENPFCSRDIENKNHMHAKD